MLLSKIAIFNVIIREKEILKFNAINKKYFPGFPQLPQYIFSDRLDATIFIKDSEAKTLYMTIKSKYAKIPSFLNNLPLDVYSSTE